MNYYKWHWILGHKKSKEVSMGMCIGVKQSEDSYEGTGKLIRRSQSEEATCCVILTMGHCGKGKTTEAVKQSVLPEVCSGGGMNRWGTEDF